MNENFSWRRLGLLLRGDVIGRYRSLLTVSATLAGLMLLQALLGVANGDESSSFYTPWFVGMLFIWGSIVASASFTELHDKTRNEAYLLLPASTLEKTLARLLFCSVGFIVYLVAFVTVTSLIVEGIDELIFGRHNALFRPHDPMLWWLVANCIVTQSLYFLGAAWFRKGHFAKTALSTVVAGIALLVLLVLVAWIFFPRGTDGYPMELYLAHKALFEGARDALWVVYFAALPLFCWFVAWLRVKETQVSHGV